MTPLRIEPAVFRPVGQCLNQPRHSVEKSSWTDRVRNEEVLQRVKEDMNILHTVKRRKADSIGHILRRNCLLEHVIQGKIQRRLEVTRGQGRRRKHALDDLMEMRAYWKL